MNATVPPPSSPKPRKPSKRDPWEGLEPAELVRLYRERGLDAHLGPWGPRLRLSQEPGGHAVIVYAGREGERAWKAIAAMHPEGRIISPRWATADGGRALLIRQTESPLLSCELSPVLSLISAGEVALPGSVEGFTLLRWKPDAHLGSVDPPEAPAWLASLSSDASARAEAREVARRAAEAVETARVDEEVAIDASRDLARERPKPSRFFDRGDSVELAHALLADLRAAAPDASAEAVVYDRATLWQYDPAGGIYVERDRADLFRLCAAYAGTPTGPKGKPLSLSEGAIKGAILTAQHLASRPGFFDAAPRGVACANGFVRVEGGEVFVDPHSHAHRATHALSFPYDRAAVAPRWDAALREIFRRQITDDAGAVVGLDEDDTEGSIALLEEFVGASLFGLATSYAMCLVLHGPGNDGKSTILNVLRALFPPSAVCSIAPQDWSRGFLLAGLAGKLLNVVNELPEREMMEGSRFKAVVSGDPLTAEKKFGDPFTFCAVAGGLFACNDLLATRDQTPGFWRRFAVLPCTRSFSASEVVHDLWRLIVAEELAGILARAVEGLARLQGNGRYSIPASATEAKADWQRDSDQVRQFVADCCVEVKKGAPGAAAEEATVEELYPSYRSWCSETGHTPVARNKLGGRLKVLGYEHRTTAARLYRLKLNAAWKAKGLTPREGGGYRAPLN